MPTLEQYKKRLQNRNRAIKEQRRQAADLNNELAWELADGHQDATILTRKEIDNNTDEWFEMDVLVRHALTGQEKKIITKPNVELPIGSYVHYSNITCIIRENLLDPQDVMPSYKAYVCTTKLHLKGCPFSFPVYAFNSSYSSKGIVDYDKVLGLDSRNKLYLQKNKFTVRLQQHHRNYRIIVGDEETIFSSENVGAIIDRPPKNAVFRIFRRKITLFSPCGDGFCLGKIHGRSVIAPTGTFLRH